MDGAIINWEISIDGHLPQQPQEQWVLPWRHFAIKANLSASCPAFKLKMEAKCGKLLELLHTFPIIFPSSVYKKNKAFK
jgi:hypothetical protein